MISIFVVCLGVFVPLINAAVVGGGTPCSGLMCPQTISMPLIDNMKATLKADIDVTEMNELLKTFIEQEINTGVQNAVRNLVENMVTTKIESERQTLDANLKESINTTYISAFTQLKKDLGNEIDGKLTEFESKFPGKDSQTYAFFATLSSSKQNMPGGAVVVFDRAPVNVGGSYDTGTGKFTCKADGLYTFSWTTLSKMEKDFTSELVVNNNAIAVNTVDNDATDDYMTGSQTVIVEMSTGDKAWIKVQSGDGDHLEAKWNSVPNTVFSGFKL